MTQNLNPDSTEVRLADQIDNMVPTHGYQRTPVVALGGSAGSIEALQAFFSAMPPQEDMAFVVVVHLQPDHESNLADILQRKTPMPVLQVRDTPLIEPGKVYVIPPGKTLRSLGDRLELGDLGPQESRPMTVDLLFRSLADSHGAHAAAVILSGVDGDGAIGIKRIKERGGLTLAQDPSQALHGGMPHAAIDGGMLDWILPVQDMPVRILSYFNLERQVRLPSEDGPMVAKGDDASDDESFLREIIAFVRARSGRDFLNYKRATVVRRIGRRMQVNGVDTLAGYLRCLRTRPGESAALLQDLLISVTNFFRDRECFTALEQLIPAMFAGKGEGDSVRAWSVACATGEEAYSLAILLSEHARTLTAAPSIQVFATDLSEEAIQQARQGYYPASIEADVDQELLRRYFVKEHNAYRVRRELREMVLFAIHDVQRDSPFSRLDLVSCRNLLIYLDRTAQKRVLDILHFALVPRGKLFLGSSETVDEDGAAFEPVDKKHRIYEKQPVTRTGLPVPPAPGDMHLNAGTLPVASAPLLSGAVFDRRSSLLAGAGTAPGGGAVSWGEFHLRLLDHLSPPSVLVDSSHMMLHVSPAAARILHVRGGEPNRDLLQALDPELRVEVRAALTQAAQTYANVEIPPVQVQVGSGKVQLRTRVVPAGNLHGPVFLLQFSESELEAPPQGDPIALPRDDESRSQYLDREVERLKYQLRATAEQYEAALEEQKASNEELQAMNEELRSGTEELETSREELQSINEELTTVNQALKIKVDELSRTNSDMQNLMDATPYATIFLNRELRITRYSPPAVPLFNLIRSDIGRPITDLKTELDYPELVRDAQAVLDNLTPIEREIGHAKGRYFVARLLPYRTIEDRIAGVVFSFVDITERRRVELDLARSDAQLRMMVESAADFAIFSMDLDRRITSWNVGAEMVLGFSEREALGQSADIIFTPEDRERGVPEKETQQALQTGRSGDERVHLRRSGERFRATGSMSLMRDGAGKAVGFVKIMRDLRQD